MEKITTVTAHLLPVMHLLHRQAEPLFHHTRKLHRLCRNLRFQIEVELNPVQQLLIPQTGKMLLIVRKMIDRGDRSQLVKTLHQNSLGIHIGKAQRPDNSLHAACTDPFLRRAEQGIRNLRIIHKLRTGYATVLLSGLGIVPVMDDGPDAPDDLSILAGQPEAGVATVEKRILLRIKILYFGTDQGRNPIGIPLVYGKRQLCELPALPRRPHLNNLNHRYCFAYCKTSSCMNSRLMPA